MSVHGANVNYKVVEAYGSLLLGVDEINGIKIFVFVACLGLILGSRNDDRQVPTRWKRKTAIPS